MASNLLAKNNDFGRTMKNIRFQKKDKSKSKGGAFQR